MLIKPKKRLTDMAGFSNNTFKACLYVAKDTQWPVWLRSIVLGALICDLHTKTETLWFSQPYLKMEAKA